MASLGKQRKRFGAVRTFFATGLYHAIWITGCVLLSPWLISRILFDPRYRAGLVERTGRLPLLVTDKKVVWIHGVSVGEIKAAGTIIERLQRSYPHVHLVISSTTPNGHAVACQQHSQHTVVYFPLDFGLFPGRALDRIAPSVVLLMELEIWPNFLRAAVRRGIAVSVINGRISARSFRGYRLVRSLLPELDLIAVYCVQDQAYRRRLLELGITAEKIQVTGNMKFDSVQLPAHQESADLRSWLSPDGRQVLVCGSTHGDEDLWLAQALARVTARTGNPVRLVLVPRHPERAPAVQDRLLAQGFSVAKWSARKDRREALGAEEVLLVDTIGQLQGFYDVGDVAFVGGSLVPHGGQNMLEPAALGKAVLFGPHVGNFVNDVELLLLAGAVVQLRDRGELEARLGELLEDPQRRRDVGRRALAVIRDNRGATERTLQRLSRYLGQPAAGLEGPDVTQPPAREGLVGEDPGSEGQGQDEKQAQSQDGQGD